jgi:hypothetical protein
MGWFFFTDYFLKILQGGLVMEQVNIIMASFSSDLLQMAVSKHVSSVVVSPFRKHFRPLANATASGEGELPAVEKAREDKKRRKVVSSYCSVNHVLLTSNIVERPSRVIKTTSRGKLVWGVVWRPIIAIIGVLLE